MVAERQFRVTTVLSHAHAKLTGPTIGVAACAIL